MNYPLTIGMAVHEDFHGAFFTVNALRMYHDVSDCELVVVDNSPHTAAGKDTRQMVANCANRWGAVKYIDAPEVVGTSAPRNRVFAEASGDAVLCMDCHVLLVPGAIARLKQHYRNNTKNLDLFSGPMLFDDLLETATHFTSRWRSAMEGTWSLAWRCTQCGNLIDVFDEPEQTTTVYRSLLSEGPFKTEYQCNCGRVAPACAWGGHEQKLIEAGWQPHGMRADDKPFEIPGQGLGLFTCRREAWLGFHPRATGFGGEELYIHRKFTKAGRKNVCLPFLGWHHRFGNPDGPKYNTNTYNKARNYVLEYQELGLDIAPVRDHFLGATEAVVENQVKPSEWEHLVADPIVHEQPPGCKTCGGGGQSGPCSAGDVPEQDAARFVALAGEHQRVAIYSKRDCWKSMLAAAEPAKLEFYPVNGTVPEINECDLLVIHSRHHAESLYAELEAMAPKVTSRILLRSTHAFGEHAEGDPGPGLLPALRRYMREHPEWHVVEHSTENWGYTVVSRAAEDRKPLPGLVTMAKNLAAAVAAHVADGLEKTGQPAMENRLNICSLCPNRVDDRCSVCGCFIAAKAAMRSSECPIGKWPEDAAVEVPREES